MHTWHGADDLLTHRRGIMAEQTCPNRQCSDRSYSPAFRTKLLLLRGNRRGTSQHGLYRLVQTTGMALQGQTRSKRSAAAGPGSRRCSRRASVRTFLYSFLYYILTSVPIAKRRFRFWKHWRCVSWSPGCHTASNRLSGVDRGSDRSVEAWDVNADCDCASDCAPPAQSLE